MSAEKKDPEQFCLTCNEKINENEKSTLSISCGQFHFLCNECFHEYFRFCILAENLQNKVPICCPLPACNQEYYPEKIFLLLDEKEYDVYTELLVKSNKFIGVNEVFIGCPFCKFGIIYTKNNVPNFFYCYDSEKCGKTSCTICYKHILYNQDYEDYDDLYQIPYTDKDPEFHFKCYEFKEFHENFQKCLEEGNMNKCPTCGYKGQKDENCCHMVCGNCSENWCYCCMKKIEKNEEHWNQTFVENQNKCPIYLDMFSEHYDEWPEDEDYASDKSSNQSVVFYHQQKLFYLLKKEILKCGQEKVKEILSCFPNLLNNISLDEIINFDLIEPLKLRFV